MPFLKGIRGASKKHGIVRNRHFYVNFEQKAWIQSCQCQNYGRACYAPCPPFLHVVNVAVGGGGEALWVARLWHSTAAGGKNTPPSPQQVLAYLPDFSFHRRILRFLVYNVGWVDWAIGVPAGKKLDWIKKSPENKRAKTPLSVCVGSFKIVMMTYTSALTFSWLDGNECVETCKIVCSFLAKYVKNIKIIKLHFLQ